jgi:integrase/recombinase XerD
MSGGPYGRGKAPRRAIMRVADWPEADRSIWEAAINEADPFADNGGERAIMRVLSNKRLCSSYGRWLTFLHHEGELRRPPASRIRKDLVMRYIYELQSFGNMSSTIHLRLTDLLLMARIFDGAADWSFISRLAERIRARSSAPKDKRGTLRGSHELLELGLQLIAQAKTTVSPLEAATMHRDGLIIALLALVPLRRRNFVQVRLGVELKRIESVWGIHISGQTTKNHSPLEFDWPALLEASLVHYLEIHRPFLAARKYRWHRRANKHLWVAQTGSALTEIAFYDIIRKRTKTAFGSPMAPHAFRHAAATTLAIHFPQQVRTAGPVLGHRTQGIAEKYYNKAISLDAHRIYIQSLTRLRNPSRRPNT